MAKLLRSHAQADQITIDCAVKVDSLRDVSALMIPGLAIVHVGSDPTASWAVQNRRLACNKVGMNNIVARLGDDASTDDVVKLVQDLCANPKWHAVYFPSPLPKQIDKIRVSYALQLGKDADGAHPQNIGMLGEGMSFQPISSTAKACMGVIAAAKIKPAGKRVVVVSDDDRLTVPVSWLLSQANATVTVCSGADDGKAPGPCKKADIIIYDTGEAHSFKGADAKPGSLVIDAAPKMVKGKEAGRVELASVNKVAKFIAPVPGGLEPLAVAHLVQNTLLLSLRQTQKKQAT